MTGVSRFWSTNGTGDGTSGGYTQADFGRYLASSLITNPATEGVLFGVLNNLVVSASGANATIGTGAAVVYDKFYYNASSFTLPIDPELTTRTDGVVLRYDSTAQTVRAAVKKNDVTVTQTAGGSGVWEILIATVSVVSGSATGATDARSYCKSPAAYGWFRSALALNSTLTVAGATTINAALSTSSATVTGNLAVNGTASFSNALSGTGIVGATNLATDSVTTVKIANSNVTADKIVSSGVTNAKIATNAVDSRALGPNAVAATNIIDANVIEAKIATGAVTADKLGSSAATSDKIATNAVITRTILDGNVTADKIISSGVTDGKIATGAVGSRAIAGSAVLTTSIVDNAITSAKLAAGAVLTTSITDNAVNSAKLSAGAVVTTSIVDSGVTEAKIAGSAVTSGKIASGAVTLGKLATNSIDEDNIKADVVTGAKIGQWAVKFGGRQGGNSDNWATPGTSEYKNPISATYGSEVLMCSGSIQISISAAASGTANVTFYDKDTASAPFATNPIMVIANNGSPDYIIDISAISTSGGTVRATHKAGTSATTTVTVWWIAIGTTVL